MLIAVLSLGVVCLVFIILFVFFLIRKNSREPDNSTLLLKQDLTLLTESVTQLKDGLQKELTSHLGRSQEGLLKQFETSNKIVADVSKQLEALKTTNQQVINVTDELKTLQNILTNPKQRGNVGEIHLETILQNRCSTALRMVKS